MPATRWATSVSSLRLAPCSEKSWRTPTLLKRSRARSFSARRTARFPGQWRSRHSSSAFPCFSKSVSSSCFPWSSASQQARDQGHDQRLNLCASRCSRHCRIGIDARDGTTSPRSSDRDCHLEDECRATMLYGFIAAIPAIVLGGPVYARFIAPKMAVRPDQALLDQFTGRPDMAKRAEPAKAAPGLGWVFLPRCCPRSLCWPTRSARRLLPKRSFEPI